MKSQHHHSEQRAQIMAETIVQLNEEVIKGQLKKLVRGSVEERQLQPHYDFRRC